MKKILLLFSLLIVYNCFAIATDISGNIGTIQWKFNKKRPVIHLRAWTPDGKFGFPDYEKLLKK